jgi:tetratricopeptide (TPR) repeat protein
VAYEVLKAFLLKNKPYNRTEKLSILLYLFNFAAYKIRQGDTIFQEEYFKLAQIGVEQSLFNAVGYFPTQTFNNIVNVGSFMKEYTWTEKFIRDWSIHLNPDDKHIARNLALARLYFEEKKFEKSDALLQELVHYKNSHFAVSIRTLLARVYYEQKTALSMQNNYCDALELYIRRIKNTNETYRKEALNFVKILRLLINERPKKQILNIINTLEVQKEPLMYVTWIKAKTDELHN